MSIEEGLGVRQVVPSIRHALAGGRPTVIGLVVAVSGMVVADLAFNLRHDLNPLGAIMLGLAAEAVVGVLLVAGSLGIARAPVAPWLRPYLTVALFVALGAVRTCLLVAGNPYPSWTLWRGQLLPVVVGAVGWLSVSAVLADWMRRAAVQRMRVETAYRQLVATRADAAAALARTETELADVMAATRAAIQEIGRRLHAGISNRDLDECIERVDRLVDREVRPSSHQLAQAPAEVHSEPVVPLGPATSARIGAIVRRWPRASPFQPEMVALAAVPLIIAEVAVAPVGLRSITAVHSFGWVLVQLGALLCARVLLTPVLRRTPWRAAIVLTFTTYVGIYLMGVAMLVRDAASGLELPLAATVFPPVFALVAGGASAAAAQHRVESAAAARLVALTGRSLSRTRQQLWARRHRLALALHGRVQANLTAASLLLRRARDEVAAGGEIDVKVVEQVREAMRLAWRIDRRPPGAVRDRLAKVTGVWSGIVEVGLTLSEHAEARLDADEDSADACVEVVREILLNATRHGGATSADVSIRGAETGLVRIRVRESGGRAPVDRRSGTGLGGTMIDAVSSRWWVHQEGGDRVTSVLLPTAPAVANPLPGPATA